MSIMWKNIFRFISQLGVDQKDSDEIRLEKNMIVASYIASASAALVWGIIYFLQGEVVSGGILLFAVMVVSFFLVDFARARNFVRIKFVMFLVYLTVPTSAMWFLGGFYHSSLMIIWSFLAPILALMTSTLMSASRWLVAYLILLVASGFIQPLLPNDNLLSDGFITTFIVFNVGATSIIVFLVLRYFIDQKNKAYALLAIEQEKSENLLLNVLPKEIADLLKEKDQTIANYFEQASILFADLVGFTQLSAKLEPAAMVELLNEVFSRFDELTDQYGLEKIRTIGDNYMVASGVPIPRDDHAQALAGLALDMRSYIKAFSGEMEDSFDFRIGINSGSLIAGVIGKNKFHYDVWGDMVNIASRMESHGVSGKIQVTRATYSLLKDECLFERRGMIEIKGKGEMETWFLIGRK